MERRRSRSDAEARFIAAVHQLLLERGFASVGINSVAQTAGLNKVLIYRYFGGLDGLLSAYAERMDPFPRILQEVERVVADQDLDNPAEVGTEILRVMSTGLRSDPRLREMLKWELAETNPLSERVAEARERSGRQLLRLFSRFVPPGAEVDLEATTALLTGGILYLCLRSATVSVFNGIPIDTPSGQERLVRAAGRMIAALLRQDKVTE